MTLNPLPAYPSTARYVLRLHRDAIAAGSLAGRIEHVSSGESAEFEDGQHLIDWLARHSSSNVRDDNSKETQ